MSTHKTSVNDSWFKRKDSNGHLLEMWCCETKSKYEVFCRLCNTSVKCDNRGFNQLLKHSETKKHVSLAEDIAGGSQLTFQKIVNSDDGQSESSASSFQEKSLTCWSNRDSVMKAELIWSMKVASSNFSYESARDLKETFCAMFPDSTIATKFSCGPCKLSYLISEATGPHFHERILNDVKQSASSFTIAYDELINAKIKKQLDLKIRYWSSNEGIVKVNHLSTFLMGRATAKEITANIMKSMNDNQLLLKDLLTLESDGPNVNKTVFQMISERKKEQHLPPLLDISTCSLHMVHNMFGKGLQEFGQQIVDLVIDLQNFFKLSPVRKEDFVDLQEDFGLKGLSFLKHVECRWLTLVPAVERVIIHWKVLKEYFLVFLPKIDSKISENQRYRRIRKCLKETPLQTLCQLHFIASVGQIFQPYLTLLQKEEPLIHVLFDCMWNITLKVLSRFIKGDILREKTTPDELKKLKFPCVDSEMSDQDLEVGSEARKFLEKMNTQTQKVVVYGMRQFYRRSAGYLMKKLPMDNTVLHDARCLKFENRCEPWTVKAIKNLAEAVHIVPPISVDIISDEWKILQNEKVPMEWNNADYMNNNTVDQEEKPCGEVEENATYNDDSKKRKARVDQYWNRIFSLKTVFGDPKYPQLTRLVKTILVIPHGNADVERGFSQTGNFLTEDRTCLSAASVNALQSTKDGLREFGNHGYKVPVTADFIKKGLHAHASYMKRLEEEKIIKEERRKKRDEEKQKQKRDLEELEAKKADHEEKTRVGKQMIFKEKDLLKKEDEAKKEKEAYNSLIEEANERIKSALKNKDIQSAQIGQTMLEAAIAKQGEKSNELETIRKEQKEVEKTKRTMLDYFLKTPAKKHKTS